MFHVTNRGGYIGAVTMPQAIQALREDISAQPHGTADDRRYLRKEAEEAADLLRKWDGVGLFTHKTFSISRKNPGWRVTLNGCTLFIGKRHCALALIVERLDKNYHDHPDLARRLQAVAMWLLDNHPHAIKLENDIYTLKEMNDDS